MSRNLLLAWLAISCLTTGCEIVIALICANQPKVEDGDTEAWFIQWALVFHRCWSFCRSEAYAKQAII